MATDIKLDQQGGNWVVVESDVLKTTAADFISDSPSRRLAGGNPHRRALVHGSGDVLTINFGNDYRGGVTVVGNLTVTGDLAVGSWPGLRAHLDDLYARMQGLENTVRALVELTGAVIIPPWRTKNEVDEGDDMGMSTPSAAALGLTVEFLIDQRNPNFEHEDVISIVPPPGTPVMRGSTVTVTINLEG
jgi:hypothetical protein